ncbi:MAG: adenine deaminase [bacterium]
MTYRTPLSDVEALKRRIRAASGGEPLDLIVGDCRLVAVQSGEIFTADIGIKEGRIVSLHARGRDAADRFDAGGRFALPGFIDAHVHIESSLLTPETLSEVLVPTGTTALFADPMEIANVAGEAGVAALLASVSRLPYRLFLEVSSRVPTAPGLETAGGALGLEEVRRLLDHPAAISLGELDPSKVLGLSDEHLAKVVAAWEAGRIANGHAAGLSGADLEAYASAGLADDHECVTFEELRERLRVGLAVLIREGSTERNLEALVSGIVREGLPTDRLMFCTDDKYARDLRREGAIDYCVNKAIALGLDPVRAVQMATINAARHFRLDDRIGLLAPGRMADVVITSSLTPIRAEAVFVGGSLAAQEGRLVVDPPAPDYPGWLLQTVRVSSGRSPTDLAIPAPGSRARVRVIEVIPDQITSRLAEAVLPVRDGAIQADPAQDVLKLAVVERHGKNGNVAVGFVRGFGLRRGSLVSSVAHDHHNLLVVGAGDADMAAAVRAAEEMAGGFAVVAGGEVLARLPLPLAGLMSLRPASEVEAALADLHHATRELGCPLPAPFMTLSFVSLPTVPEAGMTDRGLVDVRAHAFLDVVLPGAPTG